MKTIVLIWKNKVHILPNEGYYSARKRLNIPDGDITPWDWDDGKGNKWTKNFTESESDIED